MEIKDFFKKVDSELKIDFYDRICVKDPLSNPYSDNLIIANKSEYMDFVVEQLNKLFEEYKYSYYIERNMSIIPAIHTPSYAIKQDKINMRIEYENSGRCGYYILKITDEEGKKVDKSSFFYKTREFRDEEYEVEFERAKKECLGYIEDIKDSFNLEMKLVRGDIDYKI